MELWVYDNFVVSTHLPSEMSHKHISLKLTKFYYHETFENY